MPSVMIKETEVFTFEELSDSAKEKARDWYREGNLSFDWWGGVYETAETAAKLLGIDIDRKTRNSSQPAIWFSGFYCQSDYCAIEANYHYQKGSVKAIKAEFPNDTELQAITKGLQDVQKRNFYKLGARMSQTFRNNQSVDVWHCEDNYRDIGEDEELLADILKDFSYWVFSALEKEYEYLNSDECIDDGILANEYQFTEDGEIYF